MSKTLNISELADSVLALVDAEESQKVASAPETSSIKTDIGQELSKIAQQLDIAAEPTVSYKDIAYLLEKASEEAFDPESITAIKAASPAEAGTNTTGSELRKLAAQLKEQHKASKRDKLIKAAQFVTAAVSLEHLKEGLK